MSVIASWLIFQKAQRHDHRYLLSIPAVRVSIEADQICLFELNGDKDVAGRCERKYEMRNGHRRSRPKCEQPAEIQWMADVPVRPRRSESQPRIRPGEQIEVDLPKSEKIKVVDQKRADQHDEPSQCEERGDRKTCSCIFYIPNHAAYRTPLPEEE